MVWGMLETGYYHVLFELISQTKWSGWLRRHLQAFTETQALLHASPALGHVNPQIFFMSGCYFILFFLAF